LWEQGRARAAASDRGRATGRARGGSRPVADDGRDDAVLTISRARRNDHTTHTTQTRAPSPDHPLVPASTNRTSFPKRARAPDKKGRSRFDESSDSLLPPTSLTPPLPNGAPRPPRNGRSGRRRAGRRRRHRDRGGDREREPDDFDDRHQQRSTKALSSARGLRHNQAPLQLPALPRAVPHHQRREPGDCCW